MDMSGIVEYPHGIVESGTYMSLTPYVKSKSPTPRNTKSKVEGLGGAVFLPISDNLQETFTNQYETVGNAGNAFEAILASVGSNMSEIMGIFGRKAQLESGVSTVNADVAQLYKGTSPRSFNFNWSFEPANQEEAEAMRNIIFLMRYYSSPTVRPGDGLSNTIPDLLNKLKAVVQAGAKKFDIDPPDLGGDISLSFLGYPATWEVEIIHNDTRVFRVLECVCLSSNIQYAEGEFRAYRDGMPIKMVLNTEFQEMRFMTQDRFDFDSLF